MRRGSVFFSVLLLALAGGFFVFLALGNVQPERQEVRIVLPDSFPN